MIFFMTILSHNVKERKWSILQMDMMKKKKKILACTHFMY